MGVSTDQPEFLPYGCLKFWILVNVEERRGKVDPWENFTSTEKRRENAGFILTWMSLTKCFLEFPYDYNIPNFIKCLLSSKALVQDHY